MSTVECVCASNDYPRVRVRLRTPGLGGFDISVPLTREAAAELARQIADVLKPDTDDK